MVETQKAARRRNEKVGTVVSTKMTKTIVVEVVRRVPHRLYRRVVSRKSKFHVHDEKGAAQLGDRVRIIESRPLSKLKRWRLIEVLSRARSIEAAAGDSESED